MALDLTLLPMYRMNGQDIASLPGLVAATPPSGTARVRAQDRIIAYLLLTGNAVFTSTEYFQVVQAAVDAFYHTPGSLTSALKAGAESVNRALLERNMSTSTRGQYANGWLTLAALRDAQCTFTISGPMHLYWFGQSETRHIHEPDSSGKGLGISQNATVYYGQLGLSAGDRLLVAGRTPNAWEAFLHEAHSSALEAMQRRLNSLTREDLNALMIQTADGEGQIHLLAGSAENKPDTVVEEKSAPLSVSPNLPVAKEAESTPEPVSTPAEDEPPLPSPAHYVQPSAYAIPLQKETELPQETLSASPLSNAPVGNTQRTFPSSIPRAQSNSAVAKTPAPDESISPNQRMGEAAAESTDEPQAVKKEETVPRVPSMRTRQTARTLAGIIKTTRTLSGTAGEKLRTFLPRLLPGTQASPSPLPPSALMAFIAILVPLMVVTLLAVVYIRYGRSEQYETYLSQAREKRDQALTLTDPIEQRIAWENVLLNLDTAETHDQTSDTITLRREANDHLDELLGITRLQFNPAFSSNPSISISRMAANETDLYMLNAENGEVLRAMPAPGGRGLQLDTTFNCRPEEYTEYSVGPLVDILAMPGLNTLHSSVLGIDSNGHLLYCQPGALPRAVPLIAPDTGWRHITAFTMSNGNLYILDAPSRAVWVYTGKDSTFTDAPYFFFSSQTPTQDAIDLIVADDDLYLLHSDGRLSSCAYTSVVETSVSQCRDPLLLVNPFKASQDLNLFSTAHFTQLLFAAPPDPSILLLDANTRTVMRFALRSLELQNLFRAATDFAGTLPSGSADAVAVSPNHILYLAIDGQIYFSTDMP